MHSLIGGSVALAVVVAGCGLGSVLPGSVDPACQPHPDPSDCQAALDAALGDMTFEPDTFVISVEPIDCQDGRCTTWVSAMPHGEDCLPSYEVEVGREGSGGWTVLTSTHGDPPCAFEP